MAADSKTNNFVSRARAVSPQLIEILAIIDGLSAEWFANGYNDEGADEIEDSDLLGENQTITALELQQLMYTLDTARTTLDGAHRSNLQVTRP